MAENTLSVLKIAPGQYPQQVEIDNNLKALQEAVGGTIAAVYPFADPVAIICNDDGKLMGLPLNRALRELAEPVRSLGVYKVPYKVHPKVTAELTVKVTEA